MLKIYFNTNFKLIFYDQSKKNILSKLKKHLEPSFIEVIDGSHLHAIIILMQKMEVRISK